MTTIHVAAQQYMNSREITTIHHVHVHFVMSVRLSVCSGGFTVIISPLVRLPYHNYQKKFITHVHVAKRICKYVVLIKKILKIPKNLS